MGKVAPVPNGDAHRRPVGAGLSLDKFASLGVSKFDKRKKLERIQKQKVIRFSKYTKLKKKLEAQGVLSGGPIRDSVAELEALDNPVLAKGHGDDGDDRVGSHARAGAPAGRGADRHAQARPAAGSQASGPRAGPPGLPSKQLPAAGDAPGAAEQPQPTRAAGVDQPVASQPAGRAAGKRRERDAGAPAQSQREEAEGGGGGVSGRGERQRGDAEGGRAAAGQGGRHRGGSDGAPQPRMPRMQWLAQKAAEEKAEMQRAKEVAQKEREAKMQKVAIAEKARKEQKQLHFKRTAKGQPVMRYRMEKLLAHLQNDS
ncbi:hypothetical protein TSOC_000684 [Tetrabaena socialis]|uniref:rRNA-processing protein FYV7 n=1 Tax=Tetrabaena socialis TaxID=47790 RepID=A0A2J8AIP7_9CHLO|nr:hypothetical protein TSOC_000684 [Tetrabaena socialis]|eukprot:PNH12385.1 hypothetical protein TSOC_000684 [Tetrabaena socialis]